MIHWSVWLIPWSHFICKVNENLERILRTFQRCYVWCNRSPRELPMPWNPNKDQFPQTQCLMIKMMIMKMMIMTSWWCWWWGHDHGDHDIMVMLMMRSWSWWCWWWGWITDNNIFHCTHLKLSLVTFYDPLHTISNPDALWSAVLWPFVTCIVILM